MQPTIGDDGLITQMFVITAVPSPASAQRSNIYPGCDAQPTIARAARQFDDYRELTLCVFYLDGTMLLDSQMRQNVREGSSTFSGLKIVEYVYMGKSRKIQDEFDAAIGKFQFQGFPSLGVMLNNKVVARHEGLISPEGLRSLIQGAVA